MTSRERAKTIVKRFYHNSLGDIDLTLMIEQALDEKDRFWSEKVVEAEKRGAERIRERAAKILDKHSRRMPNVWADEIRALPIDSETTGATEKRRGE